MGKAAFYYKQIIAPVPNRPNHIGSAILINYNGKVLLESRKDSDRWAFIGGGLLLNETLSECVKRETFCLNGLGINYEHVHENQWCRQWCRADLDGTIWVVDPYAYVNYPEEYPYWHPLADCGN